MGAAAERPSAHAPHHRLDPQVLDRDDLGTAHDLGRGLVQYVSTLVGDAGVQSGDAGAIVNSNAFLYCSRSARQVLQRSGRLMNTARGYQIQDSIG
jgi:hypothetical protein